MSTEPCEVCRDPMRMVERLRTERIRGHMLLRWRTEARCPACGRTVFGEWMSDAKLRRQERAARKNARREAPGANENRRDNIANRALYGCARQGFRIIPGGRR